MSVIKEAKSFTDAPLDAVADRNLREVAKHQTA